MKIAMVQEPALVRSSYRRKHQYPHHQDGGELIDYEPCAGGKVKAGSALTVGGITWDGGYGLQAVEISSDGGKAWLPATLGEDLPKASKP